ncbi:MAG TPA: hypothetical protein PKI47_08205 [Fervidobacterium sp.]|nr:hypothetical protein [Fervidobacterium sp.]
METFEKTRFLYREESFIVGPHPIDDILRNAVNMYGLVNFYGASYLCPECGEHMIKTVFPTDLEINTVEGSVKIPRIFVCPTCGTFHAPRPGYKLGANNGYYLKLYGSDFAKAIKWFDKYGSTEGRRNTIRF